MSDNETPSAGPKSVISEAYFIDTGSFTAFTKPPRFFCRARMRRKPAPPMTARIIVDAKGSMVSISEGASGGMAAA